MNSIPPLDLAQQYQTISEQVSKAVLEVLASGRYIGGPPVQGFERQFAAYVGVEECVACNSGTDALYLALRALKIGPSDEVITTPFTFIATAEAIALVGARPVFVDIDPLTYNLDLNQLPAAITSKTRAILPVHLFGQPVDMTRLMAIAQSRGLAVIEDCAQATGAEWAGRKVGGIGHAGCFSFFPTKNLGACGDGGAVTTNDPALAQAIRTLKEHGSNRRYYHQETGINSRLDAVQAAILQVKLPYLDTWNDLRRQVAARYRQLLAPVADMILPQELPGGRSVWNQYTIRLLGNRLARAFHSKPASYRDLVRNRLQDCGVGAMIYYPLPLHLQPVYANLGYQAGDLPVAEQVAAEVLSLPMFPELSPEQQAQVVCTLKDCLAVPASLAEVIF